jgi:hypothetical protein
LVVQSYRKKMPSSRQELRALKGMIEEVDLILETSPELPENRTGRSRELLETAIALADDLISQAKPSSAATTLGRKGGSVTAQRGSDYFRQIAAQRKTRGGGRPRKETE